MKKLLTDIELDFYELKCLLEYLDKNPQDNRLYKVAQRSLNHLTTRMSELQQGFDDTYVEVDAGSIDPKLAHNPKVNVFVQEQEEKSIVEPIKEELEMASVQPCLEETESHDKGVEDLEEIAMPINPVLEPGVMFRALSLNDVFRFSRELFDGDSKKLKEAIAEMEKLGSYEQSIGFLSTVVTCPLDDFAFQDMDDFLKRFYKL